MDYYDSYDDTFRYKKGSQRKPPKKSNHKHIWENVILKERFSFLGLTNDVSYSPGRRCKICGKLGIGFDQKDPVTVCKWERTQTLAGVYNVCRLLPEYDDLPKIEVDNIFKMKDGGTPVE